MRGYFLTSPFGSDLPVYQFKQIIQIQIFKRTKLQVCVLDLQLAGQ
jgi:hypothetical protein